MKRHERRRSCGTRRKISATWWRRYLSYVPCNVAVELEANADIVDLYLVFFLDFAEREQEEEEAREGREIIEKEGLQVLDGCRRVIASLPFSLQEDAFHFFSKPCTLEMYVYVCMGDH